MKNIFLSYSTADDKLVNEVYEILKSELTKYEIFKFNNNDYKTSQSWAEIDTNLNKSDIFFIFISKISMQSKSVRAELYAAFHKSINSPNFIVKPIIIDDYTNWDNEFKPSAFPILNSIHRIEDFSRDSKSLSKYIVDNLVKHQWPNYVPDIQLKGVLIPTIMSEYNKELRCFVLVFKSNIDVSKVEFLYNTKMGYLNGREFASLWNGISFTFKGIKKYGGIKLNHLSLTNNSEISKTDPYFTHIFGEGCHFTDKNDKIQNILLKVSLNKSYRINFLELKEMSLEEINKFDINAMLDEM